jgi:hypothetical protein
MSSEDISPSALPFQAKLSQQINSKLGTTVNAGLAVYDFVDLAKRMLLELKVRDFTAADVVALAALIESRERFAREQLGGR